jgi:hypothetical protein
MVTDLQYNFHAVKKINFLAVGYIFTTGKISLKYLAGNRTILSQKYAPIEEG